MEAIARVRNLRGSARKARLILDLIRGKTVTDAKRVLTFSNKKVANSINKLLKSAVANATVKEGKVESESMIISKAYADEGPIMKRYKHRAQGRATIERRRTCHITLEISDDRQ